MTTICVERTDLGTTLRVDRYATVNGVPFTTRKVHRIDTIRGEVVVAAFGTIDAMASPEAIRHDLNPMLNTGTFTTVVDALCSVLCDNVVRYKMTSGEYPNIGVIIVYAGVPYYWWSGALSAREICDEVSAFARGMDIATGFLHSGCRDYAKLFNLLHSMGTSTSREYDEVVQPIS